MGSRASSSRPTTGGCSWPIPTLDASACRHRSPEEPRRRRIVASTPRAVPDHTAVRVALWRALHVLEDALPHVLEDQLGLALVAPDDDWRSRPDMGPFTRPFRASIVARARFVEDLVEEKVARGVTQYVILGAGLDTFAQRRPDLGARL